MKDKPSDKEPADDGPPRRGSPAYLEGLAVYRKHGSPSDPVPGDCPYPKGHNNRAAWFLGWIDGRTADCIPGFRVSGPSK